MTTGTFPVNVALYPFQKNAIKYGSDISTPIFAVLKSETFGRGK
jgi:hypothetical protein